MDEFAVLDASALIAYFDGEKGAEVVADLGGSRVVSTVNLAEIAQVAVRRGISAGSQHGAIERLGIAVMPFTAAHAESVAQMLPATLAAGLSLADRACLVLAQELGAPAITADRAWATVDVGVDVRVIR